MDYITFGSFRLVLKTHKPNKGMIFSLDEENLFTNVSVLEIINIIINNIYHYPTLPPLKINSYTLRKILLFCATEVPFYDHHADIYIQNDGIAMGSVLGPISVTFIYQALKIKF